MTDDSKKKKGPIREWFDSVIFAVVAATLIRWLFMEAYTIPTPSMENSMLVGDFLFVSKLHYGSRTPQTPIQMPLTHQKFWATNIDSYSSLIKLPMFRLPGFTSVKSGDVVVFNYPDSLHLPADIRPNYIKRCVGAAGDVIEVKNGQVFVNNAAMTNPEDMLQEYKIYTNEVLTDEFFAGYGVANRQNTASGEPDYNWIQDGAAIDSVKNTTYPTSYRVNTSEAIINKIKQDYNWKIELLADPAGQALPGDGVYPNSSLFTWNRDNYGPIKIPKEGESITLTAQNIALYRDVIENYEHNENVEIDDNVVKINGKAITSYTFKQNYYFMMGDNRHNSADSRFWGFVPHDHVVGKAVFVWMSLDPDGKFLNKVRWKRLFSLVK